MKKDKSSKSAATVKADTEATSKVVANARLVAKLRSYDTSLAQTQSYLVEVAEIVQNEQLTRAEVVASLMEARGIEKSTAESQFSRMKNLLTKPEVLEAVRNGEMDLKEARQQTKKEQKNPSAEKKAENLSKKFSSLVTGIVTYAKESGTDRATILNTVGSALKKNGVK